MSGRVELRALTSARGVAAWWVVLYHLRGALADLPLTVEAVLAKGYLAVDFFFLLSGFVLALRHGERLRSGGIAVMPDFLRGRVARIWPLHAVMLGFALLLLVVLRASGRAAPEFPLAELPPHLLLVQAWGFAEPLRWNDPAWSISCELAAYLLFPLWAMAIDWRRRATPALLGAIGALLLALAAAFALRGTDTLGQDIPHLGVVRCLLEFATGTLVQALWQRWHSHLAGFGGVAVAAMFGAAWAVGVPETLAAPAMLAALLLALACSGARSNPLEGALLHRLGEISYATYLSHFLLWFAFKLAFVRTATIGWPLAACYLLLVLAASVALHRLVERPAQRWINRLGFRPRRSRLPARRSPHG
ncbi:acyltransferase [Sphingomonas sp. ABOLD]|uniref:Peptidoglycan/LPS O-acetylase OafA/YrhL n=1 Tax=Sphingomonas trueperi TaxID=53317 RepID=A0A7X5XWQ5_9SPHN|nr:MULTISPECIES: acyltransferase [Sphingomonas]NJB96772.1 peptidoglycan/LPS O-acetylase OafA/YrhL [Sphingomonas trueperi]RSV51944.1 acyltransferase [Sphingomonas sp. ABOLD]